MSNTVTLKHVTHTLPARYEFFYDGLTVARDGLLTLPAEQVSQLRAAFFRGYQDTPDGRRLGTFQDLDLYIAEQTAMSAEENTSASDDAGRQSTTIDRVRKSKLKSGQEATI